MSKLTSSIISIVLQAVWSIASIWYLVWTFDHGYLLFTRFLSREYFSYETFAFLGAGLNCFVAIMSFWGALSIVLIPGWFNDLAKTICSCITAIPLFGIFIYLTIDLFKTDLFNGPWWVDIFVCILLVFIATVIFFAIALLALPTLIGDEMLLEPLADLNVVTSFICDRCEDFVDLFDDDSPLSSFLITFITSIVIALVFSIVAILIATIVYFSEIIGKILGILFIIAIFCSIPTAYYIIVVKE